MNTKQIAVEARQQIFNAIHFAATERQERITESLIQSAIEKATVTMKRQLDDSLVRELEAVQERDDANVRAARASEEK